MALMLPIASAALQFIPSGAIGPSSLGVLPLLPDGRCVDIAESDAGLGGRLWPSAGALCRWQRGVADEIRGSHVIELGCGGGAVGIYAAALGASDVTLTDGGSAELLALARANVELNRKLWADGPGCTVRVERLRWGERMGPRWVVPPQVKSWILGSDVTYARAAQRDLCVEIGSLLEANPGSRAILAHERRGARFRGLRAWRGIRGLPVSERPTRDRRLEHLEATAAELGLRVLGDVREGAAAAAEAGGRQRWQQPGHFITLLEVEVRR